MVSGFVVRMFVSVVLPVFVVGILIQVKGQEDFSANFDVEIGPVVATVPPQFLSLALGTKLIKDDFRYFNISSAPLMNMISALSPAHLRVGGTSANELVFDPGVTKGVDCHPSCFTMTKSQWDYLNRLATRANLTLLFDLNQLIRHSNGGWDFRNALQILNYSSHKGYRVNWELGNEPNSYRHRWNVTLNASQSVSDFEILRSFVDWAGPSFIVGPDVTQPKRLCPRGQSVAVDSLDYLNDFLKFGGGRAVDAVTWHHYYVPADGAKRSDFTNVTLLDCLGAEIDAVKNSVRANAPGKPIWLGETGSASGGGAPGLSDRYISTFMWLDKLGLSARRGLDLVIRQTLFKGAYALIDNDLFPRPDFWAALLHKELAGRKVLSVKLTPSGEGMGSGLHPPPLLQDCLRVYSHCTPTDRPTPHTPVYVKGSATVLMISLCNQTVYVNIPAPYPTLNLHLYSLTPSDGNLTSARVDLNSRTLDLVQGLEIPYLSPDVVRTDDSVVVQPFSSVFIVINRGEIPACL